MSGSLWVALGLAAWATVIAFVHLPKRPSANGAHGAPIVGASDWAMTPGTTGSRIS
jgi:hypothetical protein